MEIVVDTEVLLAQGCELYGEWMIHALEMECGGLTENFQGVQPIAAGVLNCLGLDRTPRPASRT